MSSKSPQFVDISFPYEYRGIPHVLSVLGTVKPHRKDSDVLIAVRPIAASFGLLWSDHHSKVATWARRLGTNDDYLAATSWEITAWIAGLSESGLVDKDLARYFCRHFKGAAADARGSK